MARRRTVEVRESTEELRQLREYYAGTRNEAPLHLLLLLKEDATRTIPDCAEICGLSARKAERVWKAYREGGMSGVVGNSSGSDSYSVDSVMDNNASGGSYNATLNQIGQVLACSRDDSWMREFRTLLYYLFPEADYIVFRCLTFGDDSDKIPATVAHKMQLPGGQTQLVAAKARQGPKSAADYFELASKAGVNLENFERDPKIIEIFLDEHDRNSSNRRSLAQIVLFRKVDSKLDPGLTQSREEVIRPFLTAFLKHLCVKPIPSEQPTYLREIALETISRSERLTQTEKCVLSLLLSGKSNRAIAEVLSASVSTIKSHLSSIYSKLGVSGKGEAVALLIGMLERTAVTADKSEHTA